MLSPTNAHTLGTAGHLKGVNLTAKKRIFSKFDKFSLTFGMICKDKALKIGIF